MKFSLRSMAAAPIVYGEQGPARADGFGILLAVVGTVLFAMKAIFVKLAYMSDATLEPVSALTLLALRMGFSLPFYLVISIYAFWRWRRDHGTAALPFKTMIISIALGALGYYVCAFLDFGGLQYITAQLERLILFTYPAFVLILGALFFGGRITRTGILSILISYSGIAVIFSGGAIATGEHLWLGVMMVLGAAFFFALFQLLAKPIINQIGGLMFTCLAMMGAAVTTLIHFSLAEIGPAGIGAALDLPQEIYLIGFCIAAVSTILPSFMINIALGRIGAQSVAVLGMINPVVTIVVAIWLLGEPFSAVDGLGTLLTIFGIGLYTWLDRRPQSQPSSVAAR